LQPGDEGYFDVADMRVPGITIVRTKEQARIVLEKLNQADPAIFHACDTEVMDIDLKSVGPVGNGYVTCASIYSGPDFDYGLGDGPGSCRIDTDDAYDILQNSKWFE
jgi:DNA polymerase-1